MLEITAQYIQLFRTPGTPRNGPYATTALFVPCLDLPQTVITSATAVPAQGSAPAYCRVLATVEPETDIEVRLPNAWAKRLLHLGGVGFEGVIPNLNGNVGELQAGYALTASNGGHRDPTRGGARFLDNPTLIDDFAHAAIEKTVRVAKAVIGAYYGRPAKYGQQGRTRLEKRAVVCVARCAALRRRSGREPIRHDCCAHRMGRERPRAAHAGRLAK